MAKKEFVYRGKKIEELKKLSLEDFAELLPTRQRRTIKRGWTDAQKTFLAKLEKKGDRVKTHCREMIVLPQMVDKTIEIHNGKAFVAIRILPEMVGHLFGELSLTRKKAKHTKTGVGSKKVKTVRK